MHYMTHEKHGAYHASDEGEVDRLKKTGWVLAKMPTADEVRASKKSQRADELKAELAALEPVAAVAPVAKKKGGRPKKAAE